MPKGGRTKEKKLFHRKIIAELYLKGYNQYAIAEHIGISQNQVSYDLRLLQSEWAESALFDFNEKKAVELAKIDHLETTYWEAWERSKKETKSVHKTGVFPKSTTSKSVNPDGKIEETVDSKKLIVTEIKEVKTERLGDPRYLDGIQWCIDKRCELLGLNAPLRVESNMPISRMSPEERSLTLSKLLELKNADRTNIN